VLRKAPITDYQNLKDYEKIFSKRKTVLVGGCFDLIHYGHLVFLDESARYGNYLIVALEGDGFIRKNKRLRPIHSQEERAKILSSLRMVDLVVKLPFFNSPEKYFEMVGKISPSVIAVSKDDPQLENKKKQASAVNGRVVVSTDRIRKYSTKKIINKLKLI